MQGIDQDDLTKLRSIEQLAILECKPDFLFTGAASAWPTAPASALNPGALALAGGDGDLALAVFA
jgi:hypothetical protein